MCVYQETCPNCGNDAGHYHADSDTPGIEIWLCEICSRTYIVVVKHG